MNEHQKKNFRIYEAVSHEAAMDAAKSSGASEDAIGKIRVVRDEMAAALDL